MIGGGRRASATPRDQVGVNVGYADRSGRNAIRDAATEVVYEFDAMTVLVHETSIGGLAGRNDVTNVERDGRIRAIDQALPLGVDRVDAEVAHEEEGTVAGSDVAVVTTGIDATHPDLGGDLCAGRAFVGGTGTSLWQDDNGHGTHVAGAGGQHSADEYSIVEARDRSNSTAEDVGHANDEQGNGLVDVPAALGLA